MSTITPTSVVDDPELLRSREWNWSSIIDRNVHEKPDEVAIRFGGASTTWRELRAQSSQLADEMAAAGVGEGDRVAILLLNRPEYIVTIAAATELGAISVPINFRLAPAELAYIFDDCDVAFVVTERALRPAVEAAVASGTARPVLDVDEGLGARTPSTPRGLVITPDSAPAFICYTSGTTGRPKGATLSWRNVRSQVDILVRAFTLTHDREVIAAATPLFHIVGMVLMSTPLAIGGTIVIHPLQNFSPVELADVVEREEIHTLFLVPAMWQAMVQLPGVSSRMPSLRNTAWGAAPASETLLRAMASAFPQAQNIALFGQTEMSPVTCVLFGEDALTKIGSVGRAADGVQLRVIDDEGNDVARGETGEIVYRGVGTMLGYWNNPAATAEAFEGGWFHSGDLVRVDEEGFVYVVDRKKDMIITGGENVYSVEVENALASHPDIVEVAVVGRHDEKWGETVVAVVVPAEGRTIALSDLDAHLAGVLAPYKRPRAVVEVAALPRNATGKVLKNELREVVDHSAV